MEFTEGQENVFLIFDKLIDSAVVIEEELSRNSSLRRRIQRNFSEGNYGSRTKNALHMYGFLDEEHIQFSPSHLDLVNCLRVGDKYVVEIDEEAVDILAWTSGNSTADILRLINADHKAEKQKDAIEDFVRNNEVDYLTTYSTYRDYHAIRKYIMNHFGTIAEFRTAFNLDYRLRTYNDRSEAAISIKDGLRFEELIGKCFESSRIPVCVNTRVNGCRPDFVVEDNHWIDAKLSKSTPFSGSSCIERYSKNAEKVTLVYAIDNISDDLLPKIPENVEIVHVFDLFTEIPYHLKLEILEVIERVSGRRISRKSA